MNGPHTIRTVGRDGAVVETAYDGLGQVCAASNPTFSDPGPLSCTPGSNPAPVNPTDGYTYFAYDALGRKTVQTQPDNNKLQWCYNGVGNSGQANCLANKSSQTGDSWVDYTDETGSHWQQASDAFGRLTAVMENDPGGSGALTLETDYGYSALDDLTSVNQKGASGDTPRTRGFIYDSLSRLTSATNPESGTVAYAYTNTGSGLCSGDPSNVCSRTDARGIVTNYSYDALNRISGKSYTNDPANTPSLTYGYDTNYPGQSVTNENNPIGHLSYIEASLGTTMVVSWTSNDYDQRGTLMGYATCLGSDAQSCSNVPGTSVAGDFNLDEELEGIAAGDSATAPYGPVGIFNYTYDNAARLTSITSQIYPDNTGNSVTTTTFTSPTYNALGQVTNANIAPDPNSGIPAIALSRTFDNRGRITSETDANPQLQAVYSYSVGYDGNSNVNGFNDSVMGNYSVTNDALHRLSQMTLGASVLTETYDNFGNRKVEVISYDGSQIQPSPYLNFTQGNNHADNFSYDASGNLLNDGTNNYLYDAEGRICAVQQASSGGGVVGYLYSPDGTRLGEEALSSFSCDMTQNGFLQSGLALTSLSTVDLNGKEIQRVDGNSNLLYMNALWEGKLLGTFAGTGYSPSNWTFAMNDWVGTKRVVVNSDGSISTSFVSGPFGDFLGNTGPGGDPSQQHFTGQEHDVESGLDYFGARYYNSNMGRFMSPDPAGLAAVNPGNPQSWNMYSYALNNPLTNIDPTGLDCVYFNDAGDAPESIDQNSNTGECGANGGDWVNGTTSFSQIQYNANSDTFKIQSSDNQNSYRTTASAPGSQTNGTMCFGNCDTPFGYTQIPNDALNPYAQRVFSLVAQQTAPVRKGLNCAPGAAVAGVASWFGVGLLPGLGDAASTIKEGWQNALTLWGAGKASAGAAEIGWAITRAAKGVTPEVARATGKFATHSVEKVIPAAVAAQAGSAVIDAEDTYSDCYSTTQ